MSKTEAISKLKKQTGFDKIIEMMRGYDFWEIVTKKGSEYSTYRVYESGGIYER